MCFGEIMSRIGKLPIDIESQVKVTITPENEVIVKGPKHSQKVKMLPQVKARLEGSKIFIENQEDSQKGRALHGLYRSLVYNAVVGVTKGFTKTLILNGVGYRCSVSGRTLELILGFSHPVKFPIPEGIDIRVEKQNTVHISGSSKEQVGQVSAKIRNYRLPEPFKGKGIRYSDEIIRRKEGKSAGK